MADKPKNKYRIVIYVVAGCEACSIMKRLVSQAITPEDNIPIDIELVGTDKSGLNYQRFRGIKDFPTTALFKYSENFDKFIPELEIIGTKPVTEIRKLILKHID